MKIKVLEPCLTTNVSFEIIDFFFFFFLEPGYVRAAGPFFFLTISVLTGPDVNYA